MANLAIVWNILIRFGFAVCCCTATLAHADSRCQDMDARNARFVESIQMHASKTAAGGQFQVKTVDVGKGRKKFNITYAIGTSEKFRVSVLPKTVGEEDFSFDSFRYAGGNALTIAASFGGSDGYRCGYLIYADGVRFRSAKIEGVFNVTDINKDGQQEFIVHEEQEWGSDCGMRVSWKRIYILDPRTGRISDSSRSFPVYFAELEQNYRAEKAVYEANYTPADKKCQKQFDSIISRAHVLAVNR